MSDFPRHESKGGHSSPLQASARKHLGEFTDIWFQAKIKLLQKLSDRITAASDSEELAMLRKELNDALISAEDVSQMDEKVGLFLGMIEKHAKTFFAFQKLYSDHRAAMHGHGHDHH